jgi:DNA mismatch endonuclease (patch repair protein)
MADRQESRELVHRPRGVTSPAWRPRPKKRYKARDPKVTSAMMASVSGKDNWAEKELRSLLWRIGFRFRLQDRRLKGRPDIVFPRYRVVIFVDGDFWHGRALVEGGRRQLRQIIRSNNFEWWENKLKRTVRRDRDVTTALLATGWHVIRVWESAVLSNPAAISRKISSALRSRLPR